jgi:hypothetical protein
MVEASCRRAWSVLLLALVRAGLAFSYVSQCIAIDTNNEKLYQPGEVVRLADLLLKPHVR